MIYQLSLRTSVWAGVFGSLALLPMATFAVPARRDGGTALRVRSDLQTRNAGPGGAIYAFGVIDCLSTDPISHTFVVENASNRPENITRLVPSCGCAAAVIEGPSGSALPLRLDPGMTVRIRTSVDPGHRHAGVVAVGVGVYVDNNAEPAVTLRMDGRIAAAITFDPSFVDFGRVRAGSRRTLLLSVRMDARLCKKCTSLHLYSGNPNLVITSIPTLSIAGPLKGSIDSGSVATSYSVSFRSTKLLGNFHGQISFVGMTDSDAGKVLERDTLQFAGETTGDIWASPSVVAFGAVEQGQGALRSIRVGGDLDKAILPTTDNAYVSAKFVRANDSRHTVVSMKPAHSSDESTRLVSVSLSPVAPPGSIETNLMLAGGHGDRLQIPVVAYIARRPSK